MEAHPLGNRQTNNVQKDNEMTNSELNRKLAELMGYYLHEAPGGKYLLMLEEVSSSGLCDEEETAWKNAPGYCTDPAAVQEVQAKALKDCPVEYIRELGVVIWGREYGDMPYYKIAELLSASPRERAEAAYITLRGETHE